MAGIFAASVLIGLFNASPSMAWKPYADWGYDAVVECPGDNLCAVVSCPVSGNPSFELMLYEHGRMTGEEVVLKVDQKSYPLVLPERGKNDLYRWALSDEMAAALQNGKTAGIVVDPGVEPSPFSLRGSGKAIQKLLAACGATSNPAVAPVASGKDGDVSLTGLSDNTDCAEAKSEGVVVSLEMTKGKREIEGFNFKDNTYGDSFINVSLPETMSESRKAALHARLLEVVQPGAKLRMKVQGCGASGAIEVVSEIIPL